MTAVALAIQKLCAIIAYNDDDAAADPMWTGRGKGEKTTCVKEDQDHHPLHEYSALQFRYGRRSKKDVYTPAPAEIAMGSPLPSPSGGSASLPALHGHHRGQEQQGRYHHLLEDDEATMKGPVLVQDRRIGNRRISSRGTAQKQIFENPDCGN